MIVNDTDNSHPLYIVEIDQIKDAYGGILKYHYFLNNKQEADRAEKFDRVVMLKNNQ